MKPQPHSVKCPTVLQNSVNSNNWNKNNWSSVVLDFQWNSSYLFVSLVTTTTTWGRLLCTWSFSNLLWTMMTSSWICPQASIIMTRHPSPVPHNCSNKPFFSDIFSREAFCIKKWNIFYTKKSLVKYYSSLNNVQISSLSSQI